MEQFKPRGSPLQAEAIGGLIGGTGPDAGWGVSPRPRSTKEGISVAVSVTLQQQNKTKQNKTKQSKNHKQYYLEIAES